MTNKEIAKSENKENQQASHGKRCKIYALVSSERPADIRYIGKTIHTLRWRLACHIREAIKLQIKNHRCNWIRKSLGDGFAIQIILLDEAVGDGCKEEISWIKHGKERGWKLTNNTDGGDGTPGRITTPETREKIRIAVKRYFESPDARKKASISARNKPPDTLETKEKKRIASEKRWASPEYKKRQQLVLYSPEVKTRRSAAIKQYYESAEAREKASIAAKQRDLRSPELKTIRSVSLKKYYESAEAREKASIAALNKPPDTLETRERKRIASQKRWASPEYRNRRKMAAKQRNLNKKLPTV